MHICLHLIRVDILQHVFPDDVDSPLGPDKTFCIACITGFVAHAVVNDCCPPFPVNLKTWHTLHISRPCDLHIKPLISNRLTCLIICMKSIKYVITSYYISYTVYCTPTRNLEIMSEVG